MGMCKPSGGVKKVYGRIGDLKQMGIPNSRSDLYNLQGELIQQRWYDTTGLAAWDRDWKHGGGDHEWPHDHYWNWTNKDKPERIAYKGPNNEKTNKNFY